MTLSMKEPREAVAMEALLDRILYYESVAVNFQPICSVTSQKITGVEALARPLDPRTQDPVPPGPIFLTARKTGRCLELDRLCRRKAFEAFAKLRHEHPGVVLFVNFDASIVDDGVVGSGALSRQAAAAGLDPASVVIEIVESKVHEIAELTRFVARHREEGFLFALDDVGAGHSNLERIAAIKPDVLKLDRGLFEQIETEYYKQEVVGALVNLGHRTGALALAEGVETQSQCKHALALGADLLQGFYLARPQFPGSVFTPELIQRLKGLADDFREHVLQEIQRRGALAEEHHTVAKTMMMHLGEAPLVAFNSILAECLASYVSLECAYVIDREGIQVSETVLDAARHTWQPKVLFGPAPAGADHSMKEYFLMLRAGLRQFHTAAYISMASGRLCHTLSTVFIHASGDEYVLCLDMSVE